MAAFAADTLISPLPPDTPRIRSFRSVTLRVLQRLEQDETKPRAVLAPIQPVFCRFDNSRNATAPAAELQEEFDEGDRASLLHLMILNAAARGNAFTARTHVHGPGDQVGRDLALALAAGQISGILTTHTGQGTKTTNYYVSSLCWM